MNIKYDVSILKGTEHTEIQSMRIIKLGVIIASIIGLIAITYYISKIKINKNLKILIIVIAMLGYITFQVLWIYNSITKPDADPGMVYGTARLLFNNKDIMKEHILKYFAFYKNNIGIVAFFETIMQIFRTDNVQLLRLVNVIFNIFTVLGLYWIYKSEKNNKKGNDLLFFILILGFIPISLLSTWVYGDFIGLSLSIWAIVFIIKYEKNKKICFAIFSGLCMALAVITRSNSIIFVIAIFIYLFIYLQRGDKSIKERVIMTLTIVLFVILAIAPNKLLTILVSNKYGLNNLKEKSIINYLYMGMSEGNLANGWFNDEVAIINAEMQNHSNDDKTVENQTKEKLINRLKYLTEHPHYTYRFYRDKIISMWAEPIMASDCYNMQGDVDMTKNKMLTTLFEDRNWKIIKLSQKIITCIIYIGSLICVILKRKNISNEMLLLILVFLGGFSFHIIWEAKSRYVIPYVVILIPLAVIGFDEFILKIKEKISKKNNI